MKALVLAGGRGKRLDEISQNKNKCMLLLGNKPVIEYSLNCALKCDVDEIIVVVGYRAEEIINAYGNCYKGKRIKYVIQWEQRGLVHAIECAKEMLEGDDFMLLLGDEILLNSRHQQMLYEFKNENAFALCGVLWVDNKDLIRRTYSIIFDKNNVVYRLVEKPRNPLNNYMGTGNCVFRNQILDYIDITPIHHERKEKELPDLIQCAIDDGKTVKLFNICDRYTNINTKDDIAIAESFLQELPPHVRH